MSKKSKITLFDYDGKTPLTVLQKAFKTSYIKTSNQLWTAGFSLPRNDAKNKQCKTKRFVTIEDGKDYIGRFQIDEREDNSNNNYINYDLIDCRITLNDKILFKEHQLYGYPTRTVLEWLLGMQRVKNWKLGKCDFTRYFAYQFENVNGLLSPIFDVPRTFNEAYRWEFDTKTWPWTLHLVKPDLKPTCHLIQGYNLKNFTVIEDSSNTVNRIYALGNAEGVNQVSLGKVNGNSPYIEDTAAQAALDGRIIEYIWVDRRFEIEENLLSSTQGMLKQWKEPTVTWQVGAVDLLKLANQSFQEGLSPNEVTLNDLEEGKVVKIQTSEYGTVDLMIMKEQKSDISGKTQDIQLDIGNIGDTYGTTVSDLENRQQINELHAQGGVNENSRTYRDDVDAKHPFVAKFLISDNVKHVNAVQLNLTVNRYRATSKALTSASTTVSSTTTNAGGGYSSGSTSSSGGGSSSSTSSGASGDHIHRMWTFNDTGNVAEPITIGGEEYYQLLFNSLGDWYTAGSSGDHSHTVNFSVPAHTHTVNITIPAHTHSVSFTVNGHTHDIDYGIYEYNKLPSKIALKVDSSSVALDSLNQRDFNIIPYLSKGSDGNVTRGFHTLTITPDDLARIEVELHMQTFIQGRIGGQF